MKRSVLLTGVLFVLVCGCAKEPPPAPPEPEPPRVYKFEPPEENTAPVPAEAIPKVPETRMVRADFNMDNLEDVAVVEEKPNGENSIAIYLQQEGMDELKKFYYRAVGIQPQGDCRISAIMSRRGPDHIDLLVILTYLDESKEMVHYRTEGTAFEEIRREAI